ncbi:MAG: antitermination protein NusG [SAR86 cluster bacterium]|uniref:Antitermination protein NusG n=1 Tax=SAR86 cluster bacterium TaxID=2030880 RepID=A0A2A4MV39_9GAMM|nr:MAG: antitermination protein NusG [SAR86 cluster bacterium]
MELSISILIEYLFRWMHFLAGITWIGLLYYFNFVQTEFFKETEASTKSGAIIKLVPRALWWFRYGALLTFITGLALAGFMGSTMNYYIAIGMLLGTLMFLNVWMIIWPNQQIVIASAEQVAGGGEAIAGAPAALAKAGLASRTNTLFSLPMLFFMGASAHLTGNGALSTSSASTVSLALVVLTILALQINGMKGKTGIMTSVVGVIHCGLGLTAILLAMMQLL